MAIPSISDAPMWLERPTSHRHWPGRRLHRALAPRQQHTNVTAAFTVPRWRPVPKQPTSFRIVPVPRWMETTMASLARSNGAN